MKTIQSIVELASTARAGEVLALATVVKVRGSAYRRPGARMLMTSTGCTAGMISGGCLEEDVRERARAVVATGKAVLVTYDSTAAEEILFGLGLGCNGIVQVLIEALPADDSEGLLSFLAACVSRRQSGKVATVFDAENLPLAARQQRWPDGSVTANFNDPLLASVLWEALHEPGMQRTAWRHIELPDGRAAEVLIETIAPPVSLTIFGAGDDAIPLAHLAKSLGWHVAVVDARPAYARPERFPEADAVYCLCPAGLLASPDLVLPPESLVMIMTHNFTRDRELLRVLLSRPLRYLGLLGPKSRTERLLQELIDAGETFTESAIARLRAPAGLDIGAETPEEIAVALVAEMQAVLAGRNGGVLRDRHAPIHDPVDQAAVVS